MTTEFQSLIDVKKHNVKYATFIKQRLVSSAFSKKDTVLKNKNRDRCIKMNLININGRDYVMSNGEVAEFLNEYVYTDMIMDEEMDALEPYDGIFELLEDAIYDTYGAFDKSLIDFMNFVNE